MNSVTSDQFRQLYSEAPLERRRKIRRFDERVKPVGVILEHDSQISNTSPIETLLLLLNDIRRTLGR